MRIYQMSREFSRAKPIKAVQVPTYHEYSAANHVNELIKLAEWIGGSVITLRDGQDVAIQFHDTLQVEKDGERKPSRLSEEVIAMPGSFIVKYSENIRDTWTVDQLVKDLGYEIDRTSHCEYI